MTNYLKKHLLFIVLFCIILFALLFILLFNKSNNDIISNDNNIVNNTNNGMFAIMLETEARSGEYQESKSNTWPGEGYIFNENLSVCENGSELTWNEELGAVNLKTNIADRCFVYFDIYILPEILEVTASDITSNSITLTVNAVAGTNAIKTYYYSINNGSYTNSSSNSYTFSGLSAGQSYSIRVYVRDTNGVDSNVYTINAETYSLEYYFAIGTKLESDGYNCGPAGTLCYLDYKTSNFQVGGTHALTYLTSFTFDKVYEVKESYYIDFTPVGDFSYEMGNEYALRHNYLVLDTQSGSTIYSYGYRLNMGPDYYDLCIVYKNGAIVVDCNTENWWDANLY